MLFRQDKTLQALKSSMLKIFKTIQAHRKGSFYMHESAHDFMLTCIDLNDMQRCMQNTRGVTISSKSKYLITMSICCLFPSLPTLIIIQSDNIIECSNA